MIYTVLSRVSKKCIGSYQGDHISIKYPFTDVINEFHYEVEDGKHPEGYYLNDDLEVQYNFDYQIPVSPPEVLTEKKLLDILIYYRSESAKFASVNSVRMVELAYTTEQKMAFVDKAVLEMKPIKDEIEMFSFYNIWGMFDAIVRDEILTEVRIAEIKAKLYTKVFE